MSTSIEYLIEICPTEELRGAIAVLDRLCSDPLCPPDQVRFYRRRERMCWRELEKRA